VRTVVPASNHPSRSRLDRITHEYELRDNLDSAWAVRPLDLVLDAGRTPATTLVRGVRFFDMSPPNLAEAREAFDCVVRDADRARHIVGRMRDHVKKAPQ
jgi:hypothetical protein